MDFNILTILSYTVVIMTIFTMIFGVIAYYFYKLRERKRKLNSANSSGEIEEKDKYLYFEEREIL